MTINFFPNETRNKPKTEIQSRNGVISAATTRIAKKLTEIGQSVIGVLCVTFTILRNKMKSV